MTTGEALLQVRSVSLAFKGVKALSEVSFDIRRGEFFSIIGPNGAGKTSLLNCISGRYEPSAGSIVFAGQEIGRLGPSQRARVGLGRTFQNLAVFAHMTVLQNILVARHSLMRNNFLTGGLYWWGGAQAEEMRHREEVEHIIELLQLQDVRHAQAGSLPYGVRKRVEIARAVALRPQLLLLDEPMAGMNLEEKQDVARYVLELRDTWHITIAMIEHDMGVVADLSDRVLVLNYGSKLAEGKPAQVLALPEVRAAYLGSERLAA